MSLLGVHVCVFVYMIKFSSVPFGWQLKMPCRLYQKKSNIPPWRPSSLHAKSFQSCPTFCNPVDCSPPGSSVHGILQARILEWVAISSSRGSFRAEDGTHIGSCVAGRFFTTSITWETWCLCWTLLKASCSIDSAWNDLPPASGAPECRCDPLGKIPEESRRPLLQLTRHSMFMQETKTPCTILGPYDIEC